MDERAIKRLLVMLAISLVAIMVFKKVMTNTYANLNRAAAEKKQVAAQPVATAPAIVEVPVIASAVEAASTVVEATALDPIAASGASPAPQP